MRSSTLSIVSIALLICAIGIFCVYSATYQKDGKVWQEIYKRQIAWVIIGIVFFLILSQLHYRRIWDAAHILYGITLLLLIAVFLLGAVRLGAQRWLTMGGFNFQPSEITKLVIVIFLARYFSQKSVFRMSLMVRMFKLFRGFILPCIFVLIPVGLVIEQPDLGTGLIIFIIFVSMAYLAGVKARYIVVFLVLACVSAPVLWHFLREYQKQRLLVFLNPNIDPLGAGYTIIQAKIAIGSGGFLGKGWLGGTQSQLRFLPEAHTDFIFSTFAEQWGFLGSATLLVLYYLLLRQGIRIALKTSDYFGKLLACGITLMLGIQVMINMAMNIGFAPIVGVPLPLMSYGGSSIFVTFMALGILANIAKTRTAY